MAAAGESPPKAAEAAPLPDARAKPSRKERRLAAQVAGRSGCVTLLHNPISPHTLVVDGNKITVGGMEPPFWGLLQRVKWRDAHAAVVSTMKAVTAPGPALESFLKRLVEDPTSNVDFQVATALALAAAPSLEKGQWTELLPQATEPHKKGTLRAPGELPVDRIARLAREAASKDPDRRPVWLISDQLIRESQPLLTRAQREGWLDMAQTLLEPLLRGKGTTLEGVPPREREALARYLDHSPKRKVLVIPEGWLEHYMVPQLRITASGDFKDVAVVRDRLRFLERYVANATAYACPATQLLGLASLDLGRFHNGHEGGGPYLAPLYTFEEAAGDP